MDAETLQHKPDSAALITGILLAFMLPLGLTVWISHVDISYYDKLFYSRFFYWGTVLILFFYARKIECRPLLIWKESKPSIGFFLLSVLTLYLLFIAAAIISAIPMLFGIRENNAVIKTIAQLLKNHPLFLFFIALTAGVTEEFIFRGYVLTRLSRLFKKPYISVIISSLLFSALHYKYNSLRELIFAFLIGIIFSVYYLKYHNIKAIMLTHFLIDFISMTLAQHFKLK
ncbi:MAG: family intrarane metalloprotease [Mucilaginibacter sp.]|nr:family intrarane metalloprotease [Mucilaginibacter sp.]